MPRGHHDKHKHNRGQGRSSRRPPALGVPAALFANRANVPAQGVEPVFTSKSATPDSRANVSILTRLAGTYQTPTECSPVRHSAQLKPFTEGASAAHLDDDASVPPPKVFSSSAASSASSDPGEGSPRSPRHVPAIHSPNSPPRPRQKAAAVTNSRARLFSGSSSSADDELRHKPAGGSSLARKAQVRQRTASHMELLGKSANTLKISLGRVLGEHDEGFYARFKEELIPAKNFDGHKIEIIGVRRPDEYEFKSLKTYVYVDGSGFLGSDPEISVKMAENFMYKNPGSQVLIVRPREGGCYNYPLPVEDLQQALKDILQSNNPYGIDLKQKIVLSGYSSGGTLMQLALQDQEIHALTEGKIVEVVLASPVMEFDVDEHSKDTFTPAHLQEKFIDSFLPRDRRSTDHRLKGKFQAEVVEELLMKAPCHYPTTICVGRDDIVYRGVQKFERIQKLRNKGQNLTVADVDGIHIDHWKVARPLQTAYVLAMNASYPSQQKLEKDPIIKGLSAGGWASTKETDGAASASPGSSRSTPSPGARRS